MIGWLEGSVVLRDASSNVVVLNVAGVGYELTVSLQTLQAVPEPGAVCPLWVRTVARPEALMLFGFGSREERTLFEMLTSVPRVGSRNAISVLGGFPPADLVACIAAGDAATLQKIPGIGKKSSEQIVLSLQDKVDGLAIALGATGADETPSEPPQDDRASEAAQVLVTWGWKPKPARAAVDRVLDEAPDLEGLEELLRRAMAVLTKRV